MVEEGQEEQKPQKTCLHRQPPLVTRKTKELDKTTEEKYKNPTEVCRRRSLAILLRGACIIISTSCSSSESLSLPPLEGKGEEGLTCRWKKRKRIRNIIETIHKKRDRYLSREGFTLISNRRNAGTRGIHRRARRSRRDIRSLPGPITLDNKSLQRFEDRRIYKR